METGLRVLGLCGSLRAASYNGFLLRAAAELAPAGMSIAPFDLGAVPPYNGDVEAQGEPPPVAALRGAVTGANAVLIASPEFNYGVPGVLKNAIDWISRPPGRSPLRKKPAAIMGASTGPSGTMRMQLQLRPTLECLEMYVMPKPEVVVSFCKDKFEDGGRLADEKTRDHVAAFLAAFLDWSRRF